MKKNILSLIAGMLCAVTVFAQAPGQEKQKRTPEERVEMRVNKMGAVLELEEEQKQELTVIYTEFHQQMKAVKESGDKEQFKSLTAEREKKVRKVLGEVKYQKYQEIRAERKAKHHQHKGEHGKQPVERKS